MVSWDSALHQNVARWIMSFRKRRYLMNLIDISSSYMIFFTFFTWPFSSMWKHRDTKWKNTNVSYLSFVFLVQFRLRPKAARENAYLQFHRMKFTLSLFKQTKDQTSSSKNIEYKGKLEHRLGFTLVNRSGPLSIWKSWSSYETHPLIIIDQHESVQPGTET